MAALCAGTRSSRRARTSTSPSRRPSCSARTRRFGASAPPTSTRIAAPAPSPRRSTSAGTPSARRPTRSCTATSDPTARRSSATPTPTSARDPGALSRPDSGSVTGSLPRCSLRRGGRWPDATGVLRGVQMLGLLDRRQERRGRPDRPSLDLRQWRSRSLAAIADGWGTAFNGYVTRRWLFGLADRQRAAWINRSIACPARVGAEEAGSGGRAGRVDEHDDLTAAVLVVEAVG